MEIASTALSTLLPKLTQLLQAEYKLQKSAREGIDDMCKELEAIDAFLKDNSKVPRDQLNKERKIWVKEVRELSYDMEDIVDTFMVDVDGPDASPSKTSFKKFFNKLKEKVNKAMTRHEIAKEIMDIKKRVVEVAARHDRYRFDANTPVMETPIDPHITAEYTDLNKLVGVNDAKQEVIMRLTKERIVSIAGFGGLGKTTLARAVFDEILGQFECSAFVSVSRNLDIYKLLKGIMLKLRMKGDGDNCGADLDVQITDLIDIIRNFLKNKRYLIVIDDIWDIGHWNMIRQALNLENNMGSRIITTTRIVGIADKIGGCYRLKPLTDENSGKLFYGRLFGKDECPEQFYELSQKILKKCGGIPLAIVTTSSMLANKSEKNNINVWYDVCDSIGLGLGSNPDLDSMRKILLLSYYDLPSHLKTCLLYLSIFPEDYEIEKRRLIWRWIAEGFVQRKHEDQSFLECGENYFNELVNRSLIQPAKVIEGTPKACRVHDFVLDLIISLSKEEGFITTVSGDGKHSLESKPVRRLSLQDDTTGLPTINMTKLRSLTLFQPSALVIDKTPSLSCCHLLRVLDLQDCEVGDLANLGFLRSLAHLRYLALSSSASKRLPEEIGKLLFLQTLNLSKTQVEELPSSFAGLTQLTCLRIRGGRTSYPWTRLPDGLLKNLTSLEVLEWATITSECFAQELGHLTRLRAVKVKVCLTNKDKKFLQACGEAMAKSLCKLNKIESLYLSFIPDSITVFMDGSVESLHKLCKLSFNQIGTLPTWIKGASLRVLSCLDVTVVHERREDIQVLGTLPCLCHLRFRVSQRAEQVLKRSEVGPDAFPSAISCDFSDVVPSMFLGGAMPKLEYYSFSINLKDFRGSGAPYTIDDLALAHLPSLRNVRINISSGRRKASEGGLRRQYAITPYNTIHGGEDVEEKLCREAASHPNHPRLETYWHM